MKRIHTLVVVSLTGLLSVVGLSSCSTNSQDHANAASIEKAGPTRGFHPSRRTFGSTARKHLEKPEFTGEKKAPTRGFHPGRR